MRRLRQQLCTGVDRVDGGRRSVGQPAQLRHDPHQGLDLERPARFDVLQHRRLVLAHSFRPRDALLDCMAERHAQLLSDLSRFAHHIGCQPAGGREAADLGQRGPGQGADRVERQIAPRLKPDLRADVGERRRAKKPARVKSSEIALTRSVLAPSNSPSGKRRPSTWRITPGAGFSAAAYAMLPIRRSTPMLRSITPSGSSESRRLPSNSPPCFLEIPPGDAVLYGHHDGLGAEQGWQFICDLGDLMGFEGENNDIVFRRPR